MNYSARDLNALTKEFYERCAQYWNNNEDYEWKGWPGLSQYIPQEGNFSVLDLGAGSGRFGHYLGREYGQRVSYTAVDFADFYTEHMRQHSIKFIRSQNIFQKDLFTESWGELQTYDVVVAFGLIHHLPLDMREHFFEQLSTVLKPTTKCIITTWQYNDIERLRKKIIAEKSDDLLPGDNILNWTKGEYGERFSHHWEVEEVMEVGNQYGFEVEFLEYPSNLENGLNNYFLFKKNT